MATGTFYLKPSADITLGHSVYPETLTAGYLAISEETNDGDATYIRLTSPESDYAECESSFKLILDTDYKIKRVNSALFRVADGYYTDGDSSDCNITYLIKDNSGNIIWYIKAMYSAYSVQITIYDINNNIIDTRDSSFLRGDYNYLDLSTALNNLMSQTTTNEFPELTLVISSYVRDSGYKDSTYAQISQAIFVLECEYQSGIGIHHKTNGTWKQAQSAYRKISGTWTEISEDECKTLLASSLCGK